MKTIKFNGCIALDFSDNYMAEKNLISIKGTTKVCWDRPVPDDSHPRLVQFCKLRGRMNHPEMCLCEDDQGCSDYRDFVHVISLDTINTK